MSPEERARTALEAIYTGDCESTWSRVGSSVGSCQRNGRTLDAEYTTDRWCNSCIAYWGLHGSFPQLIECTAA